MQKMMTALVKEQRAPGLTLQQVPIPVCGPDDVLIRVQMSSICGTDVHIYNWDAWAASAVRTPNVIGHEFAGIVEQIGERVSNVKVGDAVSTEGHLVCGMCKACRSGNAHVCPYTRSIGISRDGCFATYIVVPAANVIWNDPALPLEIACLQDPLGNAVQTVLAGDIAGKTVAVTGVGPIGLMAVAVAKACGAATIFAADVNPWRLQLAKTMGADVLIDSRQQPLDEQLRQGTDGQGVEVLLETSGSPAAIRAGLEGTAQAGRVSLLGIPAQEISLDLSRMVIFKGLQLHGITGRRMFTTWHQLKGLLEHGRLQLEPLVTHRYRLDQYEEAFAVMRSGQCGKIVFDHREGQHGTF